jgi:tRNA (cmo5U34)-methyltransferase
MLWTECVSPHDIDTTYRRRRKSCVVPTDASALCQQAWPRSRDAGQATERYHAAVETEQRIGDADRWRTADHARNWIARMDRDAGTRDEELWTLVSFLNFDTNSSLRILELGAGHGLLSCKVLERFPHARLLGLDVNPAMIAEGKRRLAAFGSRVDYREWDLADSGWPTSTDGPFDVVISSLALHHLTRQRKSELAHQIFTRLRPGGFFLNLDYVGPGSESLARRYEQSRLVLESRFAGAQRGGGGGHGHDALQPQLEGLHQAGFTDIEVFWKRAGLVLFGATRPAAASAP